MVELLVCEGVDPLAKNADGFTAMHEACARGFPEVVEYLLGLRLDVNAKAGVKEWTPLIWAARAGPSGGSASQHQNPTSDTARAYENPERLKTVLLLLRNGADSKTAGSDGMTALHRAAECGDTEVLRVLLDNGGADVNAETRRGETALHLACSAQGRAIVHAARLLLDYGAVLEAKDNDGSTPLLGAMQTQMLGPLEVKLVQMLLERGADRDAKGSDGKSASELADTRGYLIDQEGNVKKKPMPVFQGGRSNESYCGRERGRGSIRGR